MLFSRVLAHFHASPEDYSVIFTAGSTAALKLVAEAFPWVSRSPGSSGSLFCYLTDSHTSVVGMRMVATARGVTSIPVRPEDMWSAEKRGAATSDPDCQLPHLFCYPAQSNFSGTRYPLSWIGEVTAGRVCPVSAPAPGRWFVLLDAASYASTSPLDLSAHPADFVSLSFYKIFGFPTGLGALLVHNRVAPLLRKTYFGGGTAAAYLAGEDFYIPRPSVAERSPRVGVAGAESRSLGSGCAACRIVQGGRGVGGWATGVRVGRSWQGRRLAAGSDVGGRGHGSVNSAPICGAPLAVGAQGLRVRAARRRGERTSQKKEGRPRPLHRVLVSGVHESSDLGGFEQACTQVDSIAGFQQLESAQLGPG